MIMEDKIKSVFLLTSKNTHIEVSLPSVREVQLDPEVLYHPVITQSRVILCF